MIVAGSSAIIAYMSSADRHHAEVAQWLQAEEDELATTPLILAEADHLASTHGGARAARALRADLVAGAYLVEWWPEALGASVHVAERHADTGLGLADASLVALAQRLKTTVIATVDERHFRAVRPLAGAKAFRLLPWDR